MHRIQSPVVDRVNRVARGAKHLLCFVAFLLASSFQLFADPHTLVWDRNPESDVIGYRVYYGELNTPAIMIDVGNNPFHTFNDLVEGRTYFFYTTAYDTEGLESYPSVMVVHTVAPPTVPVQVSWDPHPIPGVSYRLSYGRPNQSQKSIEAGGTTAVTVLNYDPPRDFNYHLVACDDYGRVLEHYEEVTSTSTAVHLRRTANAGGGFLVGFDSKTRGSWKGVYGSNGYNVIGAGASYDSFTVKTVNYSSLTWQRPSTLPSALQHPSDLSRLATAIYSADYFDMNFTVSGSAPRQVAFYCVDFGARNRRQAIELLDSTGRSLTNITVSNFSEGLYVVWQVHGKVTFRVRNLGPLQAVVSGIFADAPGTAPVETSAQFVGTDIQTGGSWKGFYGRDGVHVVGDGLLFPAYGRFRSTGDTRLQQWTGSTTDPAALERSTSSDRLASSWWSATSVNLHFTFTDLLTHRISLYCLDWDALNREQRIDVIDTTSGNLLHRQTLSNFVDGAYLTWDVKTNVTVRVTPVSGPNAVISGIFFDQAGEVSAPFIWPKGGTFSESTIVTLESTTEGASLFYTLDGSTPTANSLSYAGPVTLTETCVLKAIALKPGLTPSPVRTGSFIRHDNVPGTVRFVRADTTRGGNWKGIVGSQGFYISTEIPNVPANTVVTPSAAKAWIWTAATTTPSALEALTRGGRRATTWFSKTSMDFALDFIDGATHKVSFYCVDYDHGNRIQDIEFYDATTGALLDSVELSAFTGGVWLEYDMRGRVLVRFSRVGGPNGVLSGIFFDPVSAPF
jgi:hypothetical protein